MTEVCLLVIVISALLMGVVFGKGSKILDTVSQKTHIWGGNRAKDGQFPYVASYQIKGTFYYEHVCSATIISRNTVLTAAHCVTSEISRVVAGSTKVLEINWGPHVQIQLVKEVVKHPDFGEVYPSPNDIAIVFLKGDFNFDTYVHKIFVPGKNYDHKIAPATVVGWGQILKTIGEMPDMQYLTVNVINNAKCGKALKAILNSTLTLGGDTICGFTKKHNGKHPCGGEGGSPLIQDDFIIGIASWSIKPCNKENTPTVYTRISKFTEFLDEAKAINYRKEELDMDPRDNGATIKNYNFVVTIVMIITAIIL